MKENVIMHKHLHSQQQAWTKYGKASYRCVVIVL